MSYSELILKNNFYWARWKIFLKWVEFTDRFHLLSVWPWGLQTLRNVDSLTVKCCPLSF